jgi:hypothetical protein
VPVARPVTVIRTYRAVAVKVSATVCAVPVSAVRSATVVKAVPSVDTAIRYR